MNAPGTPAAHIVVLMHDFYAGGAERIAITLANAWRQAGRRVTLLCGSEDGPFRARVARGVGVQTVMPPIPQGVLSRLRLGFACIRPLRELAPDAVFAPGNFHLPVIGVAARAHYAHPPVFACKLSNRLYRPSRSRVGQRVFDRSSRFWVARLDGVSAMSNALQTEARVRLRRPDIECLWEPCIPNDQPLPEPMPACGGLRLVVAGRLVPEKNVALVLRAFALLAKSRPAQLAVVGDGPEREPLQAEAARLGIAATVDWAGQVPDIRPWLARADVLIAASDYEGYPAVLVEALAAGVPVVTTDSTPALPEILLDASCGRVAGPEATALARAVVDVARVRPARQALGRIFGRHRIGAASAAYLAWFDRLVGASRVRRSAARSGRRLRRPGAP